MSRTISVVLSITLAAFLFIAPAYGQDHSRGWEPGTVWVITHVRTQPNMQNAYINDLSNVWRKFMDAQKADGHVVSYRIFQAPFARDNEPDLILSVEYKNWAAFDLSQEYFETQAAKIMGSLDDARQAGVDREALRTIGSNLVLQEISFKD